MVRFVFQKGHLIPRNRSAVIFPLGAGAWQMPECPESRRSPTVNGDAEVLCRLLINDRVGRLSARNSAHLRTPPLAGISKALR